MCFNLDYDQLIHLDAEALAEVGIGEAYESFLPKLRKYVQEPARIHELIDNDTSRYSVECGEREYVIYEPKLNEENGDSWGRAAFSFFAIVNGQLESSGYRFYAINGGNDLGGMFLTPAHALAAQKALPRKTDWPYLTEDKSPWWGQYH